MKKSFCLFIALFFIFALTGCHTENTTNYNRGHRGKRQEYKRSNNPRQQKQSPRRAPSRRPSRDKR